MCVNSGLLALGYCATIFNFGGPVAVGQMQVRPGDLLHGDRHGAQTVPIEIAPKIPEVAKRMNGEERELIDLCRSSGFTLEKLSSAVAALRLNRKNLRD
jgi:regulator of RNase E activity RraA